MCKWSCFLAVFRFFHAAAPHFTLCIWPIFCVRSINDVMFTHAKNYFSIRNRSGDMADNIGGKFNEYENLHTFGQHLFQKWQKSKSPRIALKLGTQVVKQILGTFFFWRFSEKLHLQPIFAMFRVFWFNVIYHSHIQSPFSAWSNADTSNVHILQNHQQPTVYRTVQKKFPLGPNQCGQKWQKFFSNSITITKLMIWPGGTVRTVSDHKVKKCQWVMVTTKMTSVDL